MENQKIKFKRTVSLVRILVKYGFKELCFAWNKWFWFLRESHKHLYMDKKALIYLQETDEYRDTNL